MTGIATVFAVVVTALVLAAASIRVVNQYERGVLFRLGRVIGVRQPGLRFIVPVVRWRRHSSPPTVWASAHRGYAMSSRRAPGEVNMPFLVDLEELGDEARQHLSDIGAPIAELWEHVSVAYVVEIGRARSVILDHVAEAQLVVIGTRGRGELASALLGSTGLCLLHHSPVPVAICPAPQPESEQTHAEHAVADPASAGSH